MGLQKGLKHMESQGSPLAFQGQKQSHPGAWNKLHIHLQHLYAARKSLNEFLE